jgi:maltoporin
VGRLTAQVLNDRSDAYKIDIEDFNLETIKKDKEVLKNLEETNGEVYGAIKNGLTLTEDQKQQIVNAYNNVHFGDSIARDWELESEETKNLLESLSADWKTKTKIELKSSIKSLSD